MIFRDFEYLREGHENIVETTFRLLRINTFGGLVFLDMDESFVNIYGNGIFGQVTII